MSNDLKCQINTVLVLMYRIVKKIYKGFNVLLLETDRQKQSSQAT